MIVFDLQCSAGGHVFEAWFGSTADYEEQCERGLVECPLCGCGDIRKAPMAPALALGGWGGEASGEAPGEVGRAKAALSALAAAQARALAGSTWVGKRFATEARAMHSGEVEVRPVHGLATLADAASLAAEGIAVAPLPLPVVPPEDAN